METKNLRELLYENGLNVNGEYHTFNREERNYAALLYHFLLKPKGLDNFLDLIREKQRELPGLINPNINLENPDPANVRIFFEYAHARDLWDAAKKDPSITLDQLNEKLKSVIVSLVDPTDSLGLSKLKVPEFNDFFGAKSTKNIQMPGRWNKQKFPTTWIGVDDKNPQFAKRREFAERVCTLIWAFNAKADLVIHTGNNQAICIEAKVVSAESTYTAATGDGALPFVRTQTEIQEFILDKLFGYKTIFVLLTVNGNEGIASKISGKKPIPLCWEDVFGRMDLSEEQMFVKESLKSLVIANKKKGK